MDKTKLIVWKRLDAILLAGIRLELAASIRLWSTKLVRLSRSRIRTD